MSTENSRKIIVAGVMAAVVGAGLVTFILRSHPATMSARNPPPATPVTQVPATTLREAAFPVSTPTVAQIPDAPEVGARPADVPPAITGHSSVDTGSGGTATPSAANHKLTRKQHLAKTDTRALDPDSAAARRLASLEASDKPAAKTVANGAGSPNRAAESTATPVISSAPAVDQKVGTSTEFAESDGQVTPK